MKEGTRIYVNVTNKCNTACPFCCMYSCPEKNQFMSFEVFKGIIDNCEGQFELQLEGGEPLIHRDIYLFIEYAISTNRCNKVIVLTNGIELKNHMRRMKDISVWYKIPFEFKISINYWLLEQNPNILAEMNTLVFATEFIDTINIIFNVRKRFEDEWIDSELEKYQLLSKSNVFYLQSYGKMTGSKYEKPVIVQNIDNWRIYASDGKCFGQDLIARSEYEKDL